VPAPHPPLQSYYAQEGDRREWVHGIFNRTAEDYDRMEAIVGLRTGPWHRRQALRRSGLKPGMAVIDVGTGTGLLASAAAAIVGEPALVTGIDPSPGMLEHARVPQGVRLLAGSAESMPLGDECADFICMGYALRHISDFAAAFGEFMRVMRPGARLCILEFTLPSTRVQRVLLKGWLLGVVPRLATLVAHTADAPLLMRYHWHTIEHCVPPPTILKALREAGFSDVEREVDLGMFSSYRACKPAGGVDRHA